MREAREVITLEIRARRPSTPNIDGLTDAILTALSSAGIDCEGWRDIESAPKDGTRIILFGTMQGSSVPGEEFGNWFASSNRKNGGWWVVFAMPFKPTHWRPLPLPPLASGGG